MSNSPSPGNRRLLTTESWNFNGTASVPSLISTPIKSRGVEFAHDLVGVDADALQVQIVEHDAAIGRARSAGDRQHLIERGRARKLRRQHFEQDIGATFGGLTAQRSKRLRHLRNVGAIIAQGRQP